MDELARLVDRELYPDVIEYGGLGPALRDAAQRAGVDLEPVTVPAGADGYVNVLLPTGRGFVGVFLGAQERVFTVHITVDSRPWATGGTGDLTEAARVVGFWRSGTTLRDLRERFPFMTYSRLAEGYEAGNPVEAQWQDLLDRDDLDLIRPLLVAAFANDRLSRMFPTVTMFTLARFAVDDTDRSGVVRVRIDRDGRFQVESSRLDSPRTVDTVDEAVALAAELVPEPHNGGQ
jgi:hypothetical protein